jgi:excisionase family DNA binding protein
MTKPKEILTLPEAAEILRCSVKTIRRLILDRKLECCKIRGSLRIVAKSL